MPGGCHEIPVQYVAPVAADGCPSDVDVFGDLGFGVIVFAVVYQEVQYFDYWCISEDVFEFHDVILSAQRLSFSVWAISIP